MPIHHIVAPVDFSPASRHALEVAIELAKAFKAKLDVVHSIEVLTYLGVEYRDVMSRTTWDEDRQQTDEKLDEWGAIAWAAGVEAKCKVIEGDSRRSITEYAAEQEADLIVIGAKGHSRLHDIVIGSVATQVMTKAHCSVHLVR